MPSSKDSLRYSEWSKDQTEEEPDVPSESNSSQVKCGRFIPGQGLNLGGLERWLPSLSTFAKDSFFMADRNKRKLTKE
jgi:hypothetical protein